MLYWLFVATTVIGVGTLAVLLTRRVWAARQLARLGEVPAKAGIELVQLASGVAGVVAAFTAADDRPAWFPAAVAGCVSVSVWKVVQVVVDWRLRAVAGRAKETSEAATRLLSGIRATVGAKLRRVQEMATSDIKLVGIGQVRDALTPTPQLADLLEELIIVLRAGRRRADIRVGVYVDRGGQMIPVHGADSKNPGYMPFRAYERHKAAYAAPVTAESSHVVRCVAQTRTIIVPDCVAAAAAGDFVYFHDDQRQYIRSLVAYHLGRVFDGRGVQTDAAIAVDSNIAGLFAEDDRDAIETVLQEFGLRIRLELALQALLARKDGAS